MTEAIMNSVMELLALKLDDSPVPWNAGQLGVLKQLRDNVVNMRIKQLAAAELPADLKELKAMQQAFYDMLKARMKFCQPAPGGS